MVTFGGVTKTDPYGTSRQKFKATGQFVVMVGERSVRSEAAGRRGGPAEGEVGSYPLVYAVRRLLSSQDLGLPIEALMPGRVRTLYNTRLERQAFSVFACEFQTAWIEEALPRDHWPSPPAPVRRKLRPAPMPCSPATRASSASPTRLAAHRPQLPPDPGRRPGRRPGSHHQERTMKVKAAPGIQVPKEDKPREFITDAEAVEVPTSTYYLRIVADGDLIDVDAVASATEVEAVPAETDGVKNSAKKGVNDGQSTHQLR